MRIRYDKTVWVDNETPVDACRLNKIENALEQLFTLAISPSQIEAGNGITIKILDNGNIKFSVSSEPVLDILKAGPGIKIEKVEDDNTIKISSNLDSGNYIDFDLDEETGKITISSKKQIEEYETAEDFPETGESNILYVEKENDKLYYWKEDEYKNLNKNITPLQNITWENLVELRNNSQLVPGTWYRITDYTCTTAQENTQSAGHVFDIIVRADSEDTLNENAFAIQHTGDTYFSNFKLSSWQIKYSLDNDTTRFAWADSINGKGVIYYMKDEWDNECPYDFKNIMFKRWAVSEVTDSKMTQDALDVLNKTFVFNGDETEFQARFGYQENNCTYGSTVHVVDPNDTGWYYTFSVIVNDVESGEYSLNDIEDGSIKGNNYYNDEGGGGFYGNTIKPRYNNMASDDGGIDGAQVLNNIVLNGYYENSDENPYIYGCNNNSFGGNCYDNTFGYSFSLNTFGNNFYSNTFGNNFYSNTFGNNCYSNSFGNECQNNSFGNNCYSNSFGNGCYYNSFGNGCGGNTFGNNCNWNSFGNSCNSNSFGNYCQTITVFDGVQNCSVTGGTELSPVKNAQILNGTAGASDQNKLIITFATNKNCTQIAAKTTEGTLRIWNPADPS